MSRTLNDRDKAKNCVLVVEDEPLLALEIANTLADAGYQVLGPAGSVGEALELLKTRRPDGAVLDFVLGFERVTAVALKLRTLGIPFVLASATSPCELVIYNIFAGVPQLPKPTDMHRLLETISSL